MSSRGKTQFIDFYKHIPTDLTEATSLGGMISIGVLVFMSLLCLIEFSSFLSTSTETMVVLDPNIEKQLQINFNITLLDLPCRYAVIDVLDVLGTNKQNVSKNIEKWNLDAEGKKRFFQGRNREERDIKHDEHHPSLEILLRNGEHAIPVNGEQWPVVLEENEFVFASFYAPWCVWCQRLHPIWEAFAENVEKENLPIKILKIDCVENRDLCTEQKVHAFPTLRIFRSGTALVPDYNSDRTVDAFTKYTRRKLDVERKRPNWKDRDKEYQEHPGCMVSGYLLVNRVPGNFHLEARSKVHNVNAAMTNLSHVVNHLSFGPIITRDAERKLARYEKEFHVADVLDGRWFVLDKLHTAYHHYIKVVGTMYEMVGGEDHHQAYQMLPETSVMSYSEDQVPEARFNYDISPMSVIVKKEGKRWYDFLTNLAGILGGIYTVFGIIDLTLYRIMDKRG